MSTSNTGHKIEFRSPVEQAGYSLAYNIIFRDNTLSVNARFLYQLLRSYAGQSSECYPSQETLATIMNVSTRSIQNYLNELKERGLIETIQRGLTQTNIYMIESLDKVYSKSSELPEKPDGQLDTKSDSCQEKSAGGDTKSVSCLGTKPDSYRKLSLENYQGNLVISKEITCEPSESSGSEIERETVPDSRGKANKTQPDSALIISSADQTQSHPASLTKHERNAYYDVIKEHWGLERAQNAQLMNRLLGIAKAQNMPAGYTFGASEADQLRRFAEWYRSNKLGGNGELHMVQKHEKLVAAVQEWWDGERKIERDVAALQRSGGERSLPLEVRKRLRDERVAAMTDENLNYLIVQYRTKANQELTLAEMRAKKIADIEIGLGLLEEHESPYYQRFIPKKSTPATPAELREKLGF